MEVLAEMIIHLSERLTELGSTIIKTDKCMLLWPLELVQQLSLLLEDR